MDVLFDRVAEPDIGKASVTVCVRTPSEDGKRECWLLNAAQRKAVPERETRRARRRVDRSGSRSTGWCDPHSSHRRGSAAFGT